MHILHMITSSIYGPRSKFFSPALTVISQSLFEPVDFWYFKHPCNIFYVFIIFLVGKVSVIVIVKQNYEWAIWRREGAILFGIIRYGFDSFSTRFTRRVVCFYFNFPVGDTWPAFPSIQKRKYHSFKEIKSDHKRFFTKRDPESAIKDDWKSPKTVWNRMKSRFIYLINLRLKYVRFSYGRFSI